MNGLTGQKVNTSAPRFCDGDHRKKRQKTVRTIRSRRLTPFKRPRKQIIILRLCTKSSKLTVIPSHVSWIKCQTSYDSH